MKSRPLLRAIATSIVLICLLTVNAGCFGPFNLTRNVYHWNSNIKGSGEVNEKWMKEIVFFGMIVIPVYMFSTLLDAFIFNAIQFWSGDNPIKLTRGPDGHIQEVRVGDTIISVLWSDDHRSAALTYRVDGRMMKTATIIEQAEGYRLVDDSAKSLYVMEPSRDGGLNILDRNCRLIDHASFDRMQEGASHLARAAS